VQPRTSVSTPDFPTSQNNGIALRATLADFKFSNTDTVTIPCVTYDLKTGKPNVAGPIPATSVQTEAVSITYLTFGAEVFQIQGHAFDSFGGAIGPALANAISFTSTIIQPDTCYYHYFDNNRSRVSHFDDVIGELNFRIPITIRLGLLIPFAGRVFFAPSIGLDWGVYPIGESGATITSIQPAMGIRYMP